MQKIEQVTGRGVPLPLDDIDTDRIIPARYLRCVTFEGLGEHAFEDDRKQDPNHPFNQPQYAGGSVLVAGRNFGCGSSREHAPQALIRWGIKAVVGVSFAEIFFGNCTTLGVPCVCVTPEASQKLAAAVTANPKLEITVDLLAGEVRYDQTKVPCTLLDSARKSLTTGNWDFLSQLVEGESQIRETASRLPYMTNFA
ncbi:MAG TPA: 3-isopropylmalate dehydratase small subunit [Planctomycetaceae bacterium]|nr:3-isopropylmalate dehydratase small subunit [Planctomycetaceae bacterium]